jgi:hypothetical protein
MAYTLQFAKSDVLAAQMLSGATSGTLTTGSFGSPSGTQILVIDYDVPAKAEVVTCTIAGTALTSITRATDGTSAVQHEIGAKVIMAFVPAHYAALVDGSNLTLTALPNNTILANQIATNAIKLGTATASGQSGVTVVTDVTGCSVTVTIPAGGRSVLVMAYGSASSNNAAGLTSFDIQAAGSNMTGGNFRITHNNAANSFTAMGFAVETPAAGSRTYKLRVTGVVGTSAIDATTNLVVLVI